jgi:hypothetical protein
VISGLSAAAAADVNAALPVPELHPATKTDATKTDATKTDTVEIVTPKSHRAKKLRVCIVVLSPKSQPGW